MPTGSCMCSSIHYEYSGEPQVTALCHCVDCQKWSGGAYTSNIVVPRSDFKVMKGTPKSFASLGESKKKNVHFFCCDCGSSLYTELDIMPDQTCIKSGSVDDANIRNFAVNVEFYVKDRMGYCGSIETAKQVTNFG